MMYSTGEISPDAMQKLFGSEGEIGMMLRSDSEGIWTLLGTEGWRVGSTSGR